MTTIQAFAVSIGCCFAQAICYIWDGWNADEEKRYLLRKKYSELAFAQVVAIFVAALVF